MLVYHLFVPCPANFSMHPAAHKWHDFALQEVSGSQSNAPHPTDAVK